MFATNTSLVWRLIASAVLGDEDALAHTASQVRNWKAVAMELVSLMAHGTYIRCGSLDAAAWFAARQVLADLDAVSIPAELGGQQILEEFAMAAAARKPKDEDLVEIRLRADVGMFHGHPDVRRGDVVAVDRANAKRYLKNGIAQPASWDELGVAHAPIHESVCAAL